MKLPEYLTILGKEVPVIFVEDLRDEKGNQVCGITDGNEIRICTSVNKKDRLGVMLHEMWHCFIRRSGIIQTNHDVQIEEIEADGFENIIKENFILRARNR